MSKTYSIQAVWDPEASVYVSKSDVPGLHIEAETLSAFIELAPMLAGELLSDAGGSKVEARIAAADFTLAV